MIGLDEHRASARKRPNVFRQLRRPRHPSAVEQDRRHRDVSTERLPDLDPNEVVLVIEPAAPRPTVRRRQPKELRMWSP